MNQVDVNDSIQFQPIVVGTIKYRLIEPDDFDQVSEIASYQFTTNDPLMTSLRCTKQEFQKCLLEMKQMLFNPPMSLVAIDTTNNKIVGSIITEDYNEQYITDQDTPKCLDDVAKLMISLRDDLQNKGIIPMGLNQVYHTLFASIHVDYIGQGIMKQLYKVVDKIAKSLGYKYVMAECTSSITQYICATQNYQCCFEMSYKDMQILLDGFIYDENTMRDFKDDNTPGVKFMLKSI